MTFAFSVLISLINLGSTIAFNAIVSLQLLALVFTYMTTIGCLIWRRFSGLSMPRGSWSLGRAGLPINIFASAYCLYLMVFVPFPVTLPVTAASFNWAPVMFGGVMLISLVYFLLYARKVYRGPVVYTRS